MTDDLHQRHEMRWVEWVTDQHALGILGLTDELGAGQAGRGRCDHDVWTNGLCDFGHKTCLEVYSLRCVLCFPMSDLMHHKGGLYRRSETYLLHVVYLCIVLPER